MKTFWIVVSAIAAIGVWFLAGLVIGGTIEYADFRTRLSEVIRDDAVVIVDGERYKIVKQKDVK